MYSYEKGCIIQFPEVEDKKFLVIDKYIDGDIQYLIVVPYINVDNNVDIDMSKIVLLRLDNNGNAIAETNEDTVKKVVDELLKIDG